MKETKEIDIFTMQALYSLYSPQLSKAGMKELGFRTTSQSQALFHGMD